VEADLSRLPTGRSGWLALASYAASLGDLSEVDWLELKGQLRFAERQDRKRSAVVLSRAILGMANRMPEGSPRHLGGYGIVLVGIDSQVVVGTEQVDGAVLRDAIEAYVGNDGPRWDHQFIDHPDGLVLALIVDPPQWGDSIHACRKDYSADDTKLAVRDGEVFVRVPGKTRPATSYDLSQLELRRSRAPHAGAEVRVEYDDAFDRIAPGNVRRLLESLVDHEVETLLADLPSPSSSPLVSGYGVQALLASGRGDRRGQNEFRTEVEAWRAEAEEAIDTVAADFLRHHLARGHLTIRNESDRYLEGVRVQVLFPPGVEVLIGSDTTYCDHGGPFQVFQLFPDRPPKYGSLHQYDYARLVMPRARPAAPSISAAMSPFTVEATAEGQLVTWHVGDLPSRGSERDDELFAVVTEGHMDDIVATWSVTARGVHHVFRGEMTLACRQEPGVHLAWSRNRQD